MILALLSDLTKQENEDQTVLKLVEIVNLLFAPNRIFYKSLENTPAEKVSSFCAYPPEESILHTEDGRDFRSNYKLIEDPIGFIIILQTEKTMFGIAEISDFAFPNYRDQYLTIARLIGDYGALTIENARYLEMVTSSEKKIKKLNDELEQKVVQRTKQLNQALEQEKLYREVIIKSSKFKSEFMASMSHELRTPLNSIIGFTDVILQGISGEINEGQEKFLTNVKTSAAHLLELIEGILDISEIETGKKELNIESVNLRKIINQIEIMIRLRYKKKDLTFSVTEISKEKRIQVDVSIFREILYNLLSNAIKYTKDGGITLKIMENTDEWKFDIIDTGVGIAIKDFAFILEDFKRTHPENIEGTGLGLPLTKKLVELHGGTISFVSELGKGSTFTFTIPKQ
jgi:signal transduction histidine kinase